MPIVSRPRNLNGTNNRHNVSMTKRQQEDIKLTGIQYVCNPSCRHGQSEKGPSEVADSLFPAEAKDGRFLAFPAFRRAY